MKFKVWELGCMCGATLLSITNSSSINRIGVERVAGRISGVIVLFNAPSSHMLPLGSLSLTARNCS